MAEKSPTEKRFEIAVQIRNFEIELFWKRSIFFWGFISAAFFGYAALRKLNPELGLVVACFGMVCSFAWTLLNRGSKYWQESWETKVNNSEVDVTGVFFAQEEERQDKGWWLSAQKYSVSKLAIALSDYVFLLWFFLVAAEILRQYFPVCSTYIKSYGLGVFAVFSVIYLVLLLLFGRKSPRNDS
jgi:hypothetical protein